MVAQAVKGVQRKQVDKPKPENVIVISSDEKSEKSKHVTKRQGSSRKDVKTLTSILSARSKVIYLCCSNSSFFFLLSLWCLLFVG